ncbi:MAG: metallophosphoesterase family protein [Thermomicrobiales bacterium]
MARVAAFGDLHGNLQASEAVLAAIDRERPELVVCLGDLVGYGARPNEVVALIRARDIPVLMGNYDDGVGFDRDDCGCAYTDDGERERGRQSLVWTRAEVTPEHKAWLQTLPFDWRADVGGLRLRAVHGSPRRINEYLFEDRDPASLARIAAGAGCDVLIFGHTHKPWTRDIEGVRFVNAGSVGKPKDGDPRACWALLTVDPDGRVTVDYRREPYDAAAAAAEIRAAGLPERFAVDVESGGAAR